MGFQAEAVLLDSGSLAWRDGGIRQARSYPTCVVTRAQKPEQARRPPSRLQSRLNSAWLPVAPVTPIAPESAIERTCSGSEKRDRTTAVGIVAAAQNGTSDVLGRSTGVMRDIGDYGVSRWRLRRSSTRRTCVAFVYIVDGPTVDPPADYAAERKGIRPASSALPAARRRAAMVSLTAGGSVRVADTLRSGLISPESIEAMNRPFASFGSLM